MSEILQAETQPWKGIGRARKLLLCRQICDLLDHFVGQKRLEDELVSSGFQTPPAVVHRRGHHHRNVGYPLIRLPHPADQINGLLALDLHVHEHGVWERLAEEWQDFLKKFIPGSPNSKNGE